MRVLFLCLLLLGCASQVFDTPFNPEFDRGPNPSTKYVYVSTPEEMNVMCSRKAEAPLILGCAHIPATPDGICVVILYKNGAMETREHEDKHCRYGRWHN